MSKTRKQECTDGGRNRRIYVTLWDRKEAARETRREALAKGYSPCPNCDGEVGEWPCDGCAVCHGTGFVWPLGHSSPALTIRGPQRILVEVVR